MLQLNHMKELFFEEFILPKIEIKRDFTNIDPFDGRYLRQTTSKYLSEGSRVAYQAYIEYALVHSLAEYGICSPKVAQEVYKILPQITPQLVAKQELKTRHDLKALVEVMRSKLSEQSRAFVHMGATSNDIVSVAQSLQMKQATKQVVLVNLKALLKTLIKLVDLYAETLQIGRTHGQHALPITFGFALSEYLNRIAESISIIENLLESLEAKFSGAVGTYAAMALIIENPIEFEHRLISKLGLKLSRSSTQIVPPESLTRLFDELMNVAGAIANLAHDMRHLQRTEISEIREKFEQGQTGSSTMAHKRNPISFENVASLYKQVLAQGINYRQNLISEHQRDLSDSASSRFYPILLAAVAEMAFRLNKTMAKIEVDKEAMQKNLYMLQGSIGSEPLYLLLNKYGHPDGHSAAKILAQSAIDNQQSFYEAVAANKDIMENYWPQFSKKEKEIIFNPEQNYTGLAAKKAKLIADNWRQKITGRN